MNLNFDIPFTKYKRGEVQLSYEGKHPTNYSLRFSITTKQDHAGINFMIEIWRFDASNRRAVRSPREDRVDMHGQRARFANVIRNCKRKSHDMKIIKENVAFLVCIVALAFIGGFTVTVGIELNSARYLGLGIFSTLMTCVGLVGFFADQHDKKTKTQHGEK